ncbi:MAG: glycosyltransferase [Syntrophaceae bacterium]|nr:glycosyltransferase [Syntrophaceae bacterium]
MVKLDPTKFEAVVYYLKGSRANHDEKEKVFTAVHYGQHGLKIKKINFINHVYAISKLIDQYCIDIVNCQLEKTMPIGVLAALISGKKPKVVTTVHGLSGLNGDAGFGLRKKIKNFIFYQFLNKVICVSNSIESDVVKYNLGDISHKVVSIPNGLTYKKFMSEISRKEAKNKILPSSKSDFFWFGTVGRLAEVKNHKNMINAFKQVVDKRPNCLFLIVGDGPLHQKLASQVDMLNLNENVFFLGKREDVSEVLKALDLFVFTSYREGLPLALLEAMASGLPILASNIPAVREVLGDENVGKLVAPDDPSTMAELMLSMMALPQQELSNMGAVAKNRVVNDFSADKMAKSYEVLYENICNRFSN